MERRHDRDRFFSATTSSETANEYSTDVVGMDSLSGTSSDSSDSYTVTVWEGLSATSEHGGTEATGWYGVDNHLPLEL